MGLLKVSNHLGFVCVEFYDPVNPMGSCRALSVYLTTLLLGWLSPLYYLGSIRYLSSYKGN